MVVYSFHVYAHIMKAAKKIICPFVKKMRRERCGSILTSMHVVRALRPSEILVAVQYCVPVYRADEKPTKIEDMLFQRAVNHAALQGAELRKDVRYLSR